MMLSIYKSKAGKISTKEVETMNNMEEVRKQLNLVGESNPLYFFEFNEKNYKFFQVDADNSLFQYRGGSIIDSIPDDIKITALKWLNPDVTGPFVLGIFVGANFRIDDLAGLEIPGYVEGAGSLGKSKFFKKEFSGTYEALLKQIFSDDISIPELVVENERGVKFANLAVYSKSMKAPIPYCFDAQANTGYLCNGFIFNWHFLKRM